MALRIVVRSYGGENMKGRPPYYSKYLGLLSFVRAAERTDATVVFLNNGPIPADRERLMDGVGEKVTLPGVPMRRSYWSALQFATSGRWADDDVVCFVEDDYLFHPDAFVALERAVAELTEAEYFSLYGSTPRHRAWPSGVPDVHRPTGWRHLSPWTVEGQDWVRILSTTSSFAARIGALREDLGIFRFCMVPHRHMYRDHDTLLLVQGFAPYSYAGLGRVTSATWNATAPTRLRALLMTPFHFATNLRSHRRQSRRRLLLGADPNLATHMEEGWLAPGRDWPALAADTVEWARSRGLSQHAASS